MPKYQIFNKEFFESEELYIPPDAVHADVSPAGKHKVRVVALIPIEEEDAE